MNDSVNFYATTALTAAFILVTPSASDAGDAPPPIAEWTFDSRKAPQHWTGSGGKFDEPGPQPPLYTNQARDNLAVQFAGKNGHIVIRDQDNGGPTNLKFKDGETLAVEAWIQIDFLGKDHMAYLIGKGRHARDKKTLGDENQNYAIRVKGTGNGARLGLLFSSEDPETGNRGWHRWWSNNLINASGWHHVSLAFTFGRGDSLFATIDGKPTKGTWDLGGKTNLPPVTDHADLVIGTGYSQRTSESFHGKMAHLAIYREKLAPELLASRYQFTPPPPPVTRNTLKQAKLLVQISEKGVPTANAWPDLPEVTESWEETHFGFTDWPQKYISTGVRADRANPSHFRASALITIPKGSHRLLLRGRGATRLYIDEEKVLENPFPPATSDAHHKISAQDDYLDLGPDFRFAPPGNRENWTEFTSEGGEHLVILESMIGGLVGNNPRRPEFGETVVAISFEGTNTWELLSPGNDHYAYTDQGWAEYQNYRDNWLADYDAKARESRRQVNAPYWNKRRKAAKQWIASTEEVEVPELPEGLPATNAIDHFIGARIAQVKKEQRLSAGGRVDYFEDIQPLLESRCYDCHQGGKVKGDLRLDQHVAALEGGKYDGPGITPGNPDKSSIIFRIGKDAGDDIMPPKGDPLSKNQITSLTQWIEEGAHWPQFNVTSFEPTALADDLTFLRRLFLDTVGVPPTEKEIESFLAADAEFRRAETIDQQLDDPRWADHWMGYWQDVLAENPNIINPTLNNTGPFRWWIYESLIDNKPVDLFVTELLRMEGSERFGGPAGFEIASNNDVPMAAKGIIVGSAFLGVQLRCARCHDAPAHEWRQQDLFELAAMLKEEPIKVPATSSVPMDRFHETGRKPLIDVTLEPGAEVAPAWPFAKFCDEEVARSLAANPDSPRDRLAATITAPHNERFAQVIANRVWQRLMGRGIVETVDDWEKSSPSHPDLLAWLGRELVKRDYDLKHLARLILNSHAYQRTVDPDLTEASPLYIAQAPRRLNAEQIVDSLFSATGKPFRVEELSLDVDSIRPLRQSITLGHPRRAWMLASTSNERDRPSLSLPRVQAVASIMETFGWRGARQDPVSIRDNETNVLQPAILANGTMGTWLTRLSDDHGVTALAGEDQSIETFVERLYLRLLTRPPTAEELNRYVAYLSKGYETRLVAPEDRVSPSPAPRELRRYISWSNHLDSAANVLAQQYEAEARRGDPATQALEFDWRLRLEDVLWALLNAPEWIYTP